MTATLIQACSVLLPVLVPEDDAGHGMVVRPHECPASCEMPDGPSRINVLGAHAVEDPGEWKARLSAKQGTLEPV